MFVSDHYADVSANQWMAWTPNETIKAHLNVSDYFISKLRYEKYPVV